jgi:hypothetical protein
MSREVFFSEHRLWITDDQQKKPVAGIPGNGAGEAGGNLAIHEDSG